MHVTDEDPIAKAYALIAARNTFHTVQLDSISKVQFGDTFPSLNTFCKIPRISSYFGVNVKHWLRRAGKA